MTDLIDKMDLLQDLIQRHIKGKRFTMITLSAEDCDIIINAMETKKALIEKLEDDRK